MIELSHDLNLLNKALLSILFTVSSFFWESFDGIIEMVVKFFYQVDRCEISLSNFLDGFELFMESFLVEVIFKEFFPLKLIIVEKLQNKEILLAIEFNFILVDEKSNFEDKWNVIILQDDHFGVNFSCYFWFRLRMDYFWRV